MMPNWALDLISLKLFWLQKIDRQVSTGSTKLTSIPSTKVHQKFAYQYVLIGKVNLVLFADFNLFL